MESGLVTQEQIVALGAIEVRTADLDGLTLGLSDVTDGIIVVDVNAAGYGWFVDPSLQRDEEFAHHLARGEASDPGSDATAAWIF